MALNDSLQRLTVSYNELKQRYATERKRDDDREEERRRREREAAKDREERDRLRRELDVSKAEKLRLQDELNAARKDRQAADSRRREEEKQDKTRDGRLKSLIAENDRLKKRIDALEGTAGGAAGGRGAAEEKEAAGAGEDTVRLRRDRSRLLSQRAEMIAAFRKQQKLIDVLKRQKLHLEASRLLQFTEEQFTHSIQDDAR